MQSIKRLGMLAVASLVLFQPAARAAVPTINAWDFPGYIAAGRTIRSVQVVVGYPFRFQVEAEGSPSRYGAQGLPAGLAIDAATGLITGAPAAAGSFSITLFATNTDGTGSANVTLAVEPAPTAAPELSAMATINTTYTGVPGPGYDSNRSVVIRGTNAPTSYGATGLPPNISFDPSAGVIFYDENQVSPGAYSVTCSATNALGTGSTSFQWLVHPSLLNGGITCSAARFTASGETIAFTATFNAPVAVSGTPYLALRNGTRKALYAGGSGTTQLVFKYVTTVDDGTFSETVPSAIELNSGSIQSVNGGVAANVVAAASRDMPPATYQVSIPPGAPAAAPIITGITPGTANGQGAATTTGDFVVLGSATPGARIFLWLAESDGSATMPGAVSPSGVVADSSGAWRCPGGATVSGSATLKYYAYVTDAAGKMSTSEIFTVTCQPTPAPSSGGAVVANSTTPATPPAAAPTVDNTAGAPTGNASTTPTSSSTPVASAPSGSGVVPPSSSAASEEPVSPPPAVPAATAPVAATPVAPMATATPVPTGETTAGTRPSTTDASSVDRLINISSRLHVSANGSSGEAAIAGFVIAGDAPREILVRAVGPSLSGFGIVDLVSDPRLQLFDASGKVVAQNDDWANDASIAAVGEGLGAFKLGSGSHDAALLLTLPPGAYTAQVSAATSGVALIEVYDVAANAAVPTKQLVNLSTRGYVDVGNNALVGGFVVRGTQPKRLLVRAIGPTLSGFGVAGALADPVVKIYNAQNVVIAQNDNWDTPQPVSDTASAASAAEISSTAAAAGAFPLPSGTKDAAVLLTLEPGAYTAVVTGANATTGAALVEVYEVPGN